jgi:hypothetical protein
MGPYTGNLSEPSLDFTTDSHLLWASPFYSLFGIIKLPKEEGIYNSQGLDNAIWLYHLCDYSLLKVRYNYNSHELIILFLYATNCLFWKFKM